jgi:transposase
LFITKVVATFAISMYRKGTISRNRKLAMSYRDPQTKKPRVKTVQKIEGLPIAERAKIIYEHGGAKHLTPEEWQVLNTEGLLSKEKTAFEIGDIYRGAGLAVAFNHLKQSGMFAILDKHLSRRASAIMQELIIHQMIYPNSKVKFCHQRESGIMYLLGGKRSFKEDSVYAAMDELENKFGLIKQSLYEKLPSTNDKLLLYDLSNSYFTGNKAELGGRGDSKEKRHDRFIVTYGLVTNQDNMPLDIKIWKGGTADSKTVLKTFSEWKAYYNTTKAIWVADRSMSGEPTIDEIKQLGLNYITGLPGQAQRALLMIEHGSQPELFDQQGIASINHNGGRYILCRHQSKGYRKEIQAARHRRKIFEQLKKIQNSPQNKDNKKIYHRAMKVIEKYEQTGLWKIWVESVEIKQQQRFRLMFRLDRKASVVHDKIGHYYLLQTDLDQESMNNQMVVDSYQDLIKVERSFRDLKTHIEIRPMRHWRERRIKSHIFLCFLSLWLNKYIKKCWLNQGIKSEVTPKLIQWDLDLCLCEKVNSKGSMIETKWSNGRRARATIAEMRKYGEQKNIIL